MFSRRLAWDAPSNAISEAAARRQREGGLIDLTLSNPTRAGLPYDPAMLAPLASSASLIYDPHPAGMRSAREAVCGYYAERGIAIEPDRILLTASTSEAYAFLFQLLADPGDRILVPRPSYPLFEFLAGLQSVEVGKYPLRYHEGWFIDHDALEASIDERTRAIVVVNPNNPTGSFLTRNAAERLIEKCARRGVPLLSDEVFADFGLATDVNSLGSLIGVGDGLLFAMSGLSKVCGLPQMKLGWIAVSGPERVARDAYARLEWIADTYLSVGTPVQVALPSLLGSRHRFQQAVCARCMQNLDQLRNAVAQWPGCSLLRVEGGWNAVLRVPSTQSEEQRVLQWIEQAGVLVQPGYFYEFEQEAYLVLSLLPEPHRMAEALQRVSRLWPVAG